MAPELQNLKESNEFLNLLLDNINSAVLVADDNLQIHQFNKSFLSLFDTAAECALQTGFGQTAGCVNAVMEVLDRRGPVIGFGNSLSYEQETIQLYRGDRLFLYTDGLVECRNPAGECFGKQRFFNSLREFQRAPLQAMVDGVYGRVQQFCRQSSPDDDISFLGLEYTGGSPLN